MVLDKIPTSPFLEFARFVFLEYHKYCHIFKTKKSCIVILYRSSSIRKNSWQLNHSRVSGAMGQKPLSRSNIDYTTAVCLQRWRAKRPRRKFPSYSSLNSQEMPLSFKHIFAVIPYTMPLFWRRPYIHGIVRIYMCPKDMFSAAPFRP